MSKATPNFEQRNLVTAWRQSGQSMAAFAREHGVKPATFGTWVARHPREGELGASAFLQVTAAPRHAPEAALAVRVNGRFLGFAGPPPPEWFAAVLRELGAC